MFEKAKHNARAGLDVKDELLEALAIAKKVRVFFLVQVLLVDRRISVMMNTLLYLTQH